MPLLIILAALPVATIVVIAGRFLWLMRQEQRTAREGRTGRCPACGYDLRGLASSRCPECGWDSTATANRRSSSRRRMARLDRYLVILVLVSLGIVVAMSLLIWR